MAAAADTAAAAAAVLLGPAGAVTTGPPSSLFFMYSLTSQVRFVLSTSKADIAATATCAEPPGEVELPLPPPPPPPPPGVMGPPGEGRGVSLSCCAALASACDMADKRAVRDDPLLDLEDVAEEEGLAKGAAEAAAPPPPGVMAVGG